METERKTKEELITKYGDATRITPNSSAFCAHSYEEDCVLMGGLRRHFTERIEWEWKNETGLTKYRVAYMIDNSCVKLFE